MGTRYNPGVLAYFFLIIIIICLLSIYFLNKKKTEFKRPRSYSFKIPVNLDNCELITSDFTKQGINFSEVYPLGTDRNLQLYENEINQESSKPLYIKFESDSKKYFAGPIYKDEVTVRILLMNKKDTFIYIDEISGKYFFDLTFLYH